MGPFASDQSTVMCLKLMEGSELKYRVSQKYLRCSNNRLNIIHKYVRDMNQSTQEFLILNFVVDMKTKKIAS